MCSPREFHSVCKPVGIRKYFLSTKKRKTSFLVLCGWQWSIYLNLQSWFEWFFLCMLTREPANYKKINIESDDVFELFWEYRESKVKFYHIKACLCIKRFFNPHIWQCQKINSKQHIIELTVKWLAKPELYSVKTVFRHKYIMK